MITEHVEIEKVDESHILIHCSDSVSMELSERFRFFVPGYQFTPAYKKKIFEGGRMRRAWDGTIKLYDHRTHTILAGLRQEVERYCDDNDYEFSHRSDFSTYEFSGKEATAFVKSLSLPATLAPRDYQMNAFVKSVREKRRITILPTSSGKSLVIYMLARFYEGKILIIVPTLNLIHQMASDFVDYGADESSIHKVFSGQDKYSGRKIWVSTWQSLTKMPKEWFDQFNVVIGDEVHTFAAKSLVTLMSKMSRCQHRFGFSGTLDGTKCNELQLTGLFGPIKKGITTSELIERGYSAQLNIKMIVLQHGEDARKALHKCEYADEMRYIARCERRNRFIKNLALSMKGNTLVLFQYIEGHGRILEKMIKEEAEEGRKVFFIYGGVEGEDRDAIRAIVEKEKNAIICASRKTFGTGTNIKNIHSIIFASPLKAQIANLQAIGRGLRLSDEKSKCKLYDIADDLSYDGWRNHTLRHMDARAEIYAREKFPFTSYKIGIMNDLSL